MTNKRKVINQKISSEINKKVWSIKDKSGKLIDSFRQKAIAEKYKKILEKERFEDLFLIRDKSYRINLRKNLK